MPLCRRTRRNRSAFPEDAMIRTERSGGKAKPDRTVRRQSRRASLAMLALCISLCCSACKQGVRRGGMPAGAQTVLNTSLEDIDAGRYEKLYQEAADEWRNAATLDESKATFQRLREELGNVRSRNLQSAREEQTSTAPIRGHSLVIVYQTTFDRTGGTPPKPITGMETVTLLERGGRWYLARYYVTSSALKIVMSHA